MMPLMLTELYDALKEANVSDATARKAAEAVANYDSRLAKIEGDLSTLKWMCATTMSVSFLTLGGVIGVLWRMATT